MSQPSDTLSLFVPGRVCLLGEHTDWASALATRFPDEAATPGLCLVYGTSCGLYANASRYLCSNSQSILTFHCAIEHPPADLHVNAAVSDGDAVAEATFSICPHSGKLQATLTLHLLPSTTATTKSSEISETASALSHVERALVRIASSGSFFSYVAGSVLAMLRSFPVAFSNTFSRFDALVNNHMTDLPVGKGVSSSAAVCVLSVRAMAYIMEVRPLTPEQEMDLAYRGERSTPSQCGRMDQCVAFGTRPVLMSFQSRGDDADVSCKPMEMSGDATHAMYFVVADMNRGKDTQRILSDLSSCYDLDRKEDPVARLARRFLSFESYEFTSRAAQALEARDAVALGRVFSEYQQAFDACLTPACPSQLTSTRLHELLSLPELQEHILGGKGVGSQGDGSIQFLCKSKVASERVAVALSDAGCHPFLFTLA